MLDFSDISGLGPLKPITGHSAHSSRAKVRFLLDTGSLTDGPKLTVADAPDDLSRLGDEDARVVREMRRLSAISTGGFGNVWGETNLAPISLREHPHIIGMLRGNPNLTIDRQPVAWSEATVTATLQLLPLENTIIPVVAFSAGEEALTKYTLLTQDLILSGNTIYRLAPLGDNYDSLWRVTQSFAPNRLEAYLSFFLSYFSNITPVYQDRPAHFSDAVEKSVPTIILEKVAPDQALYIRVTRTLESTGEGFGTTLPLTRSVTVAGDGAIMVREVENPDLGPFITTLKDIILKSAPDNKARKEVFCDNDFFIIPRETASPFLINHLHEVLSHFRLLGSEKLREYKLQPVFPKLKLNLSSGIDFLEGDAEVEMGNDRMSLSDLLNQYNRNKYVKLSDGNRALIDEKYMARLQRLFDNRDKSGHIKVSFFDLPEVEELINDRISGKLAAHARSVFAGFNKLKDRKTAKPKVKATLREYQTDGLNWLKYLYDNNLGGCLADDMGLGKTLQTIALFTKIYPTAKEPSLIVMPRSLLFNWENELRKFAPQLSVTTYYGPGRDFSHCADSQLILSTYAVVRNDIEELMKHQFDCVVLDESQNIKNVNSQTAKAVTLLDTRHRVALSGTPMENNLTEIYSLFRFLNPTMFGTLEAFNSQYTYPIQKHGDPEAMRSLRRKIYPFLLRRVKKDVLTELPERIEQDIFVEMSDEQRRIYEQRRVALRQEIEQTIRGEGIAKAQFLMFQALSELRRLASVPESMTDGRVRSPKIEDLVESLESAVSNGHKCVVFFNFIAGLDLVGERLSELGINFETMSGSTSTKERKRIVEQFQTDPACKVLLMTLKVGGVGLNLTAADMVYIFEPWWNKAAEEQAINRLHRIGQKASVNAFSIITVGTIEEKIRLLQQQKTELFNQLINSDSASTKHLSEEDIDFILS